MLDQLLVAMANNMHSKTRNLTADKALFNQRFHTVYTLLVLCFVHDSNMRYHGQRSFRGRVGMSYPQCNACTSRFEEKLTQDTKMPFTFIIIFQPSLTPKFGGAVCTECENQKTYFALPVCLLIFPFCVIKSHRYLTRNFVLHVQCVMFFRTCW